MNPLTVSLEGNWLKGCGCPIFVIFILWFIYALGSITSTVCLLVLDMCALFSLIFSPAKNFIILILFISCKLFSLGVSHVCTYLFSFV